MQKTVYLIAVYLFILAFLSLNPWLMPSSSLAFGVLPWDKVEHMLAYGLLSGLILYTCKFVKHKGLFSIAVLSICSLIGVGFECCQYWFTSSRNFSMGDAGANVFGALLGVMAFWSLSFIAQLRSK